MAVITDHGALSTARTGRVTLLDAVRPVYHVSAVHTIVVHAAPEERDELTALAQS